MPRLSESKADRQAKDLAEKIDSYTRRELRENKNADCESLAKKLGFRCYGTFRRRILNPKDITLGELQRVANAMNVSLGSLLGE